MKKDLAQSNKLDKEKLKSKKTSFRHLKITIVIQKVIMMKFLIYDQFQIKMIKNSQKIIYKHFITIYYSIVNFNIYFKKFYLVIFIK